MESLQRVLYSSFAGAEHSTIKPVPAGFYLMYGISFLSYLVHDLGLVLRFATLFALLLVVVDAHPASVQGERPCPFFTCVVFHSHVSVQFNGRLSSI